MVDNHSDEAQFVTLLSVLKDYGIVQILKAVIGDNSGTNDTLYCMISSYLQDSKDIIWDAKTMHLCCIGHVINLAVQAFLFFEWDSDTLSSVTLYDM